MQIDLSSFSLDELNALYKKADNELRLDLLNGASWNDMRDKRLTVTELSQAIYRKKQITPDSSPADSQLRAE